MIENHNNLDFEQQQAEENKRRLNISSSEEINLLNSMIANPLSSLDNAITELNDKGDKNENLKSNLIPQENEEKMHEVIKVGATALKKVQSTKKNCKKNLSDAKEPSKSTNMVIDCEMNIENQRQRNNENHSSKISFGQNQGNDAEQNHENDENQSMKIDYEQSHESDTEHEIYETQNQEIDPEQNEVTFNDIKSDFNQRLENDEFYQEEVTNFTTIEEINTNHEGVMLYQDNGEINQLNDISSTPSDSEELSPSVLDIISKIECNH